ncbi:reverse transcriptase [Cucumis melo var. makuwa]|uniref:Reverse transcriptase n=1 Tax=Cucumis melo var. makuwa TaxID=1194695 RepID=A0A5A7UMP8_CUCMM|nr:reverse transcriptase [Cucumis melo var. makuwa]
MVSKWDIEETQDDQTLDGTLAEGIVLDINAAVVATVDGKSAPPWMSGFDVFITHLLNRNRPATSSLQPHMYLTCRRLAANPSGRPGVGNPTHSTFEVAIEVTLRAPSNNCLTSMVYSKNLITLFPISSSSYVSNLVEMDLCRAIVWNRPDDGVQYSKIEEGHRIYVFLTGFNPKFDIVPRSILGQRPTPFLIEEVGSPAVQSAPIQDPKPLRDQDREDRVDENEVVAESTKNETKQEDPGCKWVFALKYRANSILDKHKARLKQSPRAWFDRFTTIVKSQGYNQRHSDHNLFTKVSKTRKNAVLIVYVDDTVLSEDVSEDDTV